MKFVLFIIVLASFAVAQPFIAAGGVLNVSSSQPILAPGVVFVVYGANLGQAVITIAPAPYVTPLAGTTVTFTPVGGGTPISPRLYFTLANAVAGVLPSTIAPGTYAVRVSYNGQTSSAQNVTVVARRFGIAAANGFGFGVAQATIANVNGGYSLTRFTTSGTPGGTTFINAPAHANDTISLWGTGGGADALNDNGGSSGDQKQNFQIILAGQTITPSYAGAVAGYPGLWVINFTIPANATPDCFTTVQVNTNGELSNAVTIPIAAAGQASCANSLLTPAQLTRLDAGGTVAGGGFSLSKFTSTGVTSIGGQLVSQTVILENVNGGFGRYNSAQFVSRFGQRKTASCSVFDATGNPDALPNPGLPSSFLNAGDSIPIAGPGFAPGSAVPPLATPFFSLYNLQIAPGTVTAGKYTITGNGGPDLGPFTASLTVPGSFTVTNWNNISTISRSQPFTVNWTGGGTESVQVILAGYTTVSGSPFDRANQVVHQISIICLAPAAAQTFTIPADLMSLLPPGSFDESSGTRGGLTVTAISNPDVSQITAPLTLGGQLDYGYWWYALGFFRNIALN